MSKRTSALKPISLKKKLKLSHNQSSLDSFFSLPGSSTIPEGNPNRGKQSQPTSVKSSSHVSLPSATSVSLKKPLPLPRLAPNSDRIVGQPQIQQSVRIQEVIDVDAISDNEAGVAGPSSAIANDEPSLATKTTPDTFCIGTARKAIVTPQYRVLSIDPVTYEILSCPWESNKAPPYSFLAHTLAELSETRSRIAISNILTNCLRTISKFHPSSLLPALYLLSNTLTPPYSAIELGLGPSIISKAIQHISGLSSVALRKLYNATGDPGDVALEAKSNIRTLIPHPSLLIPGVYESLLKIANVKGQGAAKQKQVVVEKLLVAAKGEEIRFLVRTLSQNLRVGAVRTSILTALARAMVLTPPTTIESTSSLEPEYHVDQSLLSQIKRQDAKKKQVDPARDILNDKFQRAEALLKKVYVQHPNYDHITEALLEVGLCGLLDRLPLDVGIPLLPTLGSPTRSLDEIYDRLGLLPFAAEFKYDGQRAQIHAEKVDSQVQVKIFSRHLEDMTDKYPDVISMVEEMFTITPQTSSFIIDAEIVAVDPGNGDLKSFQELSNRARRDVKLSDVKVSVCVFAFDLMFLDGQILLEKPFRERRNFLRTRFPTYTPPQLSAARFTHVQSCESEDGRVAVEEFWQTAVNSRSEGLMIKLLDSGEILEETSTKKDKPRKKPLPATYEPGAQPIDIYPITRTSFSLSAVVDKRTSAWLKLKKDYVTGLGDSLDLVPIGAWHGNGRKANWWSPILLALWDPSAGKLVAVCKCMSGFSDTFYKALRERYPEESETCSRQPLWDTECETGGLKPEVYFKPQEVWEIRGADVTISPVSVAALGLISNHRGLSLRFPRFIKIREDKGIENASTPDFLANMYKAQEGRGRDKSGADEGELVDVDIEVGDSSDIEMDGSQSG